LKKLIDPKKKTLIVAETLTSYLNPLEHDFLIKNIERLLNKINHGAYLSHEGNKMLPGLFGKILLFYRNRVAKTQSHKHFEGLKEIRNYFESRGAKKIKIYESKRSNNIIYLVVRK
jgi:O-methyltransferase involved in polyketide biosynthesis